MLKFICDLSSPDITAHRLYQAGIQRNGGNRTVDLHRVHCLLQDRFSSVVRYGHRAVNHDGRPLSTGTGSGIKSVGKLPKRFRLLVPQGLKNARSALLKRVPWDLSACSAWV